MAFSVSAGVNISEIDLTTIVPGTSTTEGAIAGVFGWGPVGEATLISNESALAARFGKPTNNNAETWFVAADFLSYGNSLLVTRAANTTDAAGTVGVLSAIANTGAANLVNHVVKSASDWETKQATVDSDVHFIARCPGALGNSIRVAVCETANQFSSTVANTAIFPANASINVASAAISFVSGDRFGTVTIAAANATILDTVVTGYATTTKAALDAAITEGDLLLVSGQYVKVANIAAPTVASSANGFIASIKINLADEYTRLGTTTTRDLLRSWEFSTVVDGAPGQSEYVAAQGNTAASDEVHAVIVDAGGAFTGVPGQILEVYQNLSRATNARSADGQNIFYKNVINDGSNYVWAGADRVNAASATAAAIASATNVKPQNIRMAGGSDGATEDTVTLAVLAAAYDTFTNAEQVDVSIIMAGKAVGGSLGEGLAKYIKDNVVDTRLDCVLTVSPPRASVVNNVGSEASSIVAFRNALGSSSYLIMDSGYKYRYDKYNDMYRYVPLNGDIAGLMVRTDDTRDPWFSPAGFNRGQIKNIVKLAWNPDKANRDTLYKKGVNPVVTFPGQGTILYGDKTLLAKPSAFDRINVRRLFIVLEKAIATASKFTLFEYNDEFTRAQFRSLVEPFLRDVQGRRGIYDFRVVCDETNNTGEVIDRNEFVGDIYIKPARSINFIQLNFVAVRSGVEFSEVVGKF